MKKTRRAVGYVCEIPIPGTDLVISKEFQKQRMLSYARWEKIELVDVVEDEAYTEDFMSQPGIRRILDCNPDVDTLLVERVWCLSRRKGDLEPFLQVLDQRNIQLVSSSYLWDCLSQQVRHRYLGIQAEKRRKAAQAFEKEPHERKAA